MIFSPTLACADPLHLASQIKELADLGMKVLHIDVMDGHYVPNLCFSLDTIRRIHAAFPAAQLDVHLMVSDPAAYIEPLAGRGVRRLCFHLDATRFALRTLGQIRAAGMQAGVVLNPSQPVEALAPVLPQLDFVLLMSVEPGFSGQTFLEASYQRVAALARWRGEEKLPFQILVDGGVTPAAAARLQSLQADLLVLGIPFLFGQPGGITAAWHKGKQEMDAALRAL